MAGETHHGRRPLVLLSLAVVLGCGAGSGPDKNESAVGNERYEARGVGEPEMPSDHPGAAAEEELAAARSAQRSEILDRTRSMNVLLIVVDALRADLLADTEANRRDFPNLLRLRDESRWFDRAFAPGAGTDVSMAGVFTGRINSASTIDLTLAEALGATGRRTHAVVPNEVYYFAGTTLLSRGFDDRVRLINDPVERNVSSFASSTRTTQLATKFVDEWTAAEPEAGAEREPFFSWVHYFDVHEHHQIPTGDRKLLAATGGRRGSTPEEKYRALARLVDQNVGALLDELRASGVLDETIIVLMSDHGEGLKTDPRLPDHHGQFVYNALVHVPLAVRIPGVEPRSIPEPVSLIDLYPTLIELAGGAPSELTDGVSLVPQLLQTPPSPTPQARVLPLNEVEQFGVVQWPYKLLVHREDGRAEVYDLSTDWNEQHDLSPRQPELAIRLREAYQRLPRVVVDRTRKARRIQELAARKP